jgi:hypothetical protein
MKQSPPTDKYQDPLLLHGPTAMGGEIDEIPLQWEIGNPIAMSLKSCERMVIRRNVD